MRETRLTRNGGGEARLLRTDDRGTTLLDAATGHVVAEHGNDRHNMLLAELSAEGWAPAVDDVRAPAAAPGRPPGNLLPERPGETGLDATETDGEDA